MIRRVALAYFTLYAFASHVFLWAWPAPDGTGFAPRSMARLVTAVAAALGMGPLEMAPASIDRRFDFVQAGVIVVLAVMFAGAWTLWRRPDATAAAREHARLHLLLRWSLAAVFIGYGWVKVFPVQFPYPGLVRMMEPVGTLPLPTLFITTLGASRPFLVVIGIVEVAAALLLLGPRTWRLAAPVVLASCLSIALLNLTFDITDKLFTLHLTVMAMMVAAPDLARIGRWLAGGPSPIAPAPLAPVIAHATARRVAALMLVVWAGYVNVVWARASHADWQADRARLAAPHPLRGVWVTEGTRREDGDTWASLVIDPPEAAVFRQDGTVELFEPDVDDAAHRLTLWHLDRPSGERGASAVFRWTLAGDALRLEAGDDGPVARVFRRWDTRVLLLPQQQFRWIQERRARGQ